MPVVMLTRCIVIACAPEVKQSAREKNQSHSALSEEKIPSRDARTAFPLRVKNVFMHIKNCPEWLIQTLQHLPARMNPRAPKWFPRFFSATALPGLRFNEKAMDTILSAWYVMLAWAPWLRRGWRRDRSMSRSHSPKATMKPPNGRSKF